MCSHKLKVCVFNLEPIPSLQNICSNYLYIYFALLALFPISATSPCISWLPLALNAVAYVLTCLQNRKTKFKANSTAVHYLLNILYHLFRFFALQLGQHYPRVLNLCGTDIDMLCNHIKAWYTLLSIQDIVEICAEQYNKQIRQI